MIFSNIKLGLNVSIDPSSSVNNIEVSDNVKISKNCSVFGSPATIVYVGEGSYIGPGSFIQGFAAQLMIGKRVSIAQNVNIMTNSGPNASEYMQLYFPIQAEDINIGDDSWIGANSIIMPGVSLGEFCVVAANSFVNTSFPAFSVIGGNPARLLRMLDPEVVKKIIFKDEYN